jgi:MinD superfamily P-loop ATPase
MKAIVICGGEGTGKTTLAQKIAEERGSYRVISFDDFMSPFLRGAVLEKEPKTVIIEEFEFTEDNVARIKPFISCRYCQIDRKGKRPVIVNSPYFILTTTDLPPHDRRFEVVNVEDLP